MNIFISHGPVEEMKELGNSTCLFILEDGSEYKINFSIQNGVAVREIITSTCNFYDELDFMETIEDAVQWTVDNFEEILYIVEACDDI